MDKGSAEDQRKKMLQKAEFSALFNSESFVWKKNYDVKNNWRLRAQNGLFLSSRNCSLQSIL
jgi:hypothetical protein